MKKQKSSNGLLTLFFLMLIFGGLFYYLYVNDKLPNITPQEEENETQQNNTQQNQTQQNNTQQNQTIEIQFAAGCRSTLYGVQQQKTPQYWVDAADFVADKVSAYETSLIYGIGGINDEPPGTCYLNFPHSGTYSHIEFSNVDQNENYLDAFDAAGYKVFLQVEPGLADIPQVIDLVLTQYSHHSSVIGFGVDAEWLGAPTYSDGRVISESELNSWLNKVKTYNPNYKLFVKHWDYAHFPSNYNAEVIYIDDSLSLGSLNNMVNEFKNWGTHFSNADVGFQVGYPQDMSWWGNMNDPVAQIGNELKTEIPNMKYYYWVDFSIEEIYTK